MPQVRCPGYGVKLSGFASFGVARRLSQQECLHGEGIAWLWLITKVLDVREQVSGRGHLLLDSSYGLAGHGESEGVLLRDFGLDRRGQAPRAAVRSVGECHNSVCVALVVGHLRLAEQDIALHHSVLGFLRPLHRPVVPIGGGVDVPEIAVKPTGELGAVRAD